MIEPYKEATFRLNKPLASGNLGFYITWMSSKTGKELKANELKYTATDMEPFTLTAKWYDDWDDELLDQVTYGISQICQA